MVSGPAPHSLAQQLLQQSKDTNSQRPRILPSPSPSPHTLTGYTKKPLSCRSTGEFFETKPIIIEATGLHRPCSPSWPLVLDPSSGEFFETKPIIIETTGLHRPCSPSWSLLLDPSSESRSKWASGRPQPHSPPRPSLLCPEGGSAPGSQAHCSHRAALLEPLCSHPPLFLPQQFGASAERPQPNPADNSGWPPSGRCSRAFSPDTSEEELEVTLCPESQPHNCQCKCCESLPTQHLPATHTCVCTWLHAHRHTPLHTHTHTCAHTHRPHPQATPRTIHRQHHSSGPHRPPALGSLIGSSILTQPRSNS